MNAITPITTRKPARQLDEFISDFRSRAGSTQLRSPAQHETVEPKPPAEIMPLPIWPNAVRGVPNSVLRSALFGIVVKGRRAFQDAVKKASVEGITVIHTGPKLDQADLDVWMQCLHLARINGLGVQIRFSASSFLREIGRANGKSQHEWLKSSLRRLMTSLVEMTDGNKAYAGQLLHKWFRDERSGEHIIEFNPDLSKIYGEDGWTQSEWLERQALRKQQLAQWLHGWFSSHAQPFAIKVSTLLTLCESESTNLYHFRAELKKAMNKIENATGWKWHIDKNDNLHITKRPSSSQRRHLNRKAGFKARHSTDGGTA